MAQSLREILVRPAFEPCHIPGGRVMAVQTATKPSLTLKRRLKAPPAKVYDAWTDPTKIARWWGPAQAQFLGAETDARVGGRFHVRFATPDGEQHDVSGVYREVVPDEKLVFTWA